jgi:hypothetical protein
MGPALDLLKRAMTAINQIHAEQRQHANDMLAAIDRPKDSVCDSARFLDPLDLLGFRHPREGCGG